MKPYAFVLKSLLVAATLGAVAVAGAESAPAKPAPGTPSAKKTEPTKPDPKKQAEEEMGTIPGTTIARANGTFLGLTLEGGRFRLSFYNEKKKPVPGDALRATARWNPSQKTGSEFTVLNPSGDKMSLMGGKFVQPPYNYKVYFTLILDESGGNNETYVIDFRG
ncbi:MAG: hypothetical protein PHE83_16800 [Opitutaceae bacterium]|nr:hypothetical protein [Opitutaceae bacterium]